MAQRQSPPNDDGPGVDRSDDLSFESALSKVEDIIERIESGEVGLEDAIAQYEAGVGLIERCRSILEQAEQRVTDLTERMASRASGGAADAEASPDTHEE